MSPLAKKPPNENVRDVARHFAGRGPVPNTADPGYRTVKVPMWVYNNAVAARAELMRRGLNAIPPELLEPPACPQCGGAVEHVAVGYSRVHCGSCGYTQQSVAATATDLGSLGLGVLLGLGLAALMSNLAVDDKPAPRRRATRRR